MLFGVAYGFGAKDGEFAAEGHHDVGVIDGGACCVGGIEEEFLVAHEPAKFVEHDFVGADGAAGIGDFVDAVEDEAAGTFEEAVFLLKILEVDALPDGMLFGQFVDDVFAPLGPAQGRKHGPGDDGAPPMEADPVVRKDGIGLGRRGGVLYDMYLHAGSAQLVDEGVKFCAGSLCNLPCIGLLRRLLKGVVRRRLGIVAKGSGADHEDLGSGHGGELGC